MHVQSSDAYVVNVPWDQLPRDQFPPNQLHQINLAQDQLPWHQLRQDQLNFYSTWTLIGEFKFTESTPWNQLRASCLSMLSLFLNLCNWCCLLILHMAFSTWRASSPVGWLCSCLTITDVPTDVALAIYPVLCKDHLQNIRPALPSRILKYLWPS